MVRPKSGPWPKRNRTESIAVPKPLRAAPSSSTTSSSSSNFKGYGRQGTATCKVCGAEVALKKLAQNDLPPKADRTEPMIKAGDLVLSPHRPGGGRCDIRRGDVLCRGSKELP